MFDRHYIIVDDFYPNPDEVRGLALSLPTDGKDKGNNYPGEMTTSGFWSEEHTKMMSYLTKEEVYPLSFPNLHSLFRFTKETDTSTQFIHYDSGPSLCWAGVIFLSKPENYTDINGTVLDSGTSFWKHKERNIDSIPVVEEDLKIQGWKTLNDSKPMFDREGKDLNKWVFELNIPIKYNRLILFRPWMFHSPGTVKFGNSKENCRLVQLIFLKYDS